MILKLFASFSILLFSFHSQGQVLGLEPPNTKWQKITTPYAEIIFEPQAILKAQRTANLIQYIAERDSSFIGGPAQFVPIILHGQSTLPAGVPNLAPWRSDWSLTAPQDPFMGSLVWIDGLSIHEYRHHQQMTRAKHGWFSDFLRVVLGQTGWYVGVLTIQPNWFFEGDATYTETMLTNGGRGRMPKFDRDYRTLRISQLNYNYEKASRRSRKDFVPNIYREGYYLTSFARKHFGTDIWTKVLEDTYKKKGFFYPFSRSLKSLTGYRTKDLYQAAMVELDSIWLKQDKSLELTESKLITTKPKKKIFTHYRFPYYLPTGEVLTEKISFEQIRTYYKIDNQGKETLLFKPGNVTPDHENLMVTGNNLAWAENRFHPRWDLKDYSVIFTYNLLTQKKRQITHKSRYYAPCFSYDGKFISALELNTNGTQQLVILDALTGQKISEIAKTESGQYLYPRITKDDQYIITGYTDRKGSTLRKYNIQSGEFEDLIPVSHYIATRPYDHGGFIYYSGSNTGINNIFSVDLKSGEVFQVTSSRFGAHMPSLSPDGKKLLYSEYTALGFEIREMDIDVNNWMPYNYDTPSSLNYYQSLAEAEGGSITDEIPQESYVPEKFNSVTKGLLKFHTWTPSLSENEYGLEFLSNNIMSNTSASAGYRYNINDKTNVIFTKLSYGALFPIVDLGYSYNIRNDKVLYNDQYEGVSHDWNENQFDAGLRIPFRLSSGTYATNLAINGHYNYYKLSDIRLSEPPEPDTLNIYPVSKNDNFHSAEVGLQFSRFQSRRQRLIKPRWGQSLSMNLNRSFESQDYAELLIADASLFFPGFTRTHSFFMAAQCQQENLVNTYRFENTFIYPRGYNRRYFSDESLLDFDKVYYLTFNYFFPIAFTDIDLGSVAYFQTVSANLFYDHSRGQFNGSDTWLRSAGVDIEFEFTSLRLFLTTVTLRGLYRFDQPEAEMKPFLFDIVFNISDLAF